MQKNEQYIWRGFIATALGLLGALYTTNAVNGFGIDIFFFLISCAFIAYGAKESGVIDFIHRRFSNTEE